MAEYEQHTETIERVVYQLLLPTNWAEVAKMDAAVNSELTSRCMPRTDNAVIVECDDEYLRYVIEIRR